MRLSMLCLALALSLGACAERDAARVDCGTPSPNGVDCRIVRTGGDSAFKACWDLVITCQNGGAMTGSTCHEMAAGIGEGSQNMPVSAFSNQATCDAPASGKVERLKIVSH